MNANVVFNFTAGSAFAAIFIFSNNLSIIILLSVRTYGFCLVLVKICDEMYF